jgi:hypothetical protein
MLLCTDGLASCYGKQALGIFREALRTGRVGRPRLILPEGIMVARVKKRYVCSSGRGGGCPGGCEGHRSRSAKERLMETQRSIKALINTAYIESD